MARANIVKKSNLNAEGDEQSTLLAFLRRRHPEYVRTLAHWVFLEETYKGGREWFLHNVFRYIKEGDQEFKERLQRSYRFNHTREVVDLIGKYIFKSSISRNKDDATEEVNAFWDNATLAGLTIDQYMRLISTASSIFGRIWVFVDSSKTDDVISKKDEKIAGARAYSYFVKPIDALDMGFDEDTGRLRWILVREYKRDDEDPIRSTGMVEERFRLWTETEWRLYRIVSNTKANNPNTPVLATSAIQANPDLTKMIESRLAARGSKKERVELVDSGENPLGEVPCFPVDNVIGDGRYSAPSLIADIAYLDRAIANYLSNLDAIIQDQTFSQLAMPAQGIIPGEEKYNQLINMGTKRIFLFDGEGGVRPEYLSPDPKQAQIIVDVINKIINEIYHSVGMAGERTKQDNSVGIDNSSGVAKAYDFERLNSLLTTKSQSLQNCENRLARLVDLWNGADPDTIDINQKDEEDLVRYPDTFDIYSLFDEFTIAERLSLIDAPDEVRREQMKAVIDKLFPTLARDLKEKIMTELKSWPPQQVDDLRVVGTISGNPPNKFPAKGIVKSGANSPDGAAPIPAKKNPQTQKRQGQVTSETK